MKSNFFLYLFLLGACSSPKESEIKSEKRIITAGGTITEIVSELGLGDLIVATDITSTYPTKMKELPSIGYRNQIKSEGILSMNPDVILAETDYLSADVVAQLKATGIEVKFFEKPTSVKGAFSLISDLANYLGVTEKGKLIQEEVKNELLELAQFLEKQEVVEKPTMLFIMARGEDMVFVGGDDTFASSIIQLSGLQSPVLGFKDFIPLTPEALAKFNPDYILMFDSGLATLGGEEGLTKIRGIEQTHAFQNGQILAFDGLLLSGFGPRVAEVALEIAKSVYP
ncbi:ABC-type hemin transport system, periplasmic component [Belliella baltica DSM 15883]|uniref:ABC-type hemin transport system, periplasmic component n=1 Tax=Belliella baltica (strain DSM 15883 / CIP 108006 / LMG 21964 / BA134) TaxID=866536 RepID=I3Z2F5_BELBD|nr:ABC transporter substrate-binding protein [Belliella baltica]AFL83423.1 ABC-type hemin transport system, periplasmic component [Belliella baltica DSM 15883]